MNFAYAARTGGSSELFRHNLTYLELMSTGRLHYIVSSEVKEAIAGYFTSMDSLSNTRDDLPRGIFERFRELAGSSPIFFTDRGYSISSAEKSRLVEELNTNPLLERELRYLASRLEFLDAQFEDVLQANDDLANMLQNY